VAGFLPSFLDLNDERDAVTQINERYAHGGGWHDFTGFTLSLAGGGPVVGEASDDYRARYPGDPAYRERSRTQLRDETIVMFDHSWTAVIQRDGSFRMARLD